MSRGVAPTVLVEQVRNTAAWALEGPLTEWRTALRDAGEVEARWNVAVERPPELVAAHLRVMLSAHYVTVGTFVPTDVDTRIRHHAWQEMHDVETLRAALDVVDRAAAWDPRVVSARVVETRGGALSGHDGEWFAVRAGAIGRALQLQGGVIDASDVVERTISQLDAELTREADAMREAVERGDALHALRVSTILAHNVGDLSRVVEEWPTRSPEARALQARWARLGHEDPRRHDGAFVLAGRINKAVMATENHRFLPLRRPRSLRRARALLLPIGPFFDEWGATIARHSSLEAADRAEVLAALLEGHEGAPTQLGYLRAIAGLHAAHAGGVEAIAALLPARARKRVGAGAVREALGVDRARFEARMANRWRAALAERKLP